MRGLTQGPLYTAGLPHRLVNAIAGRLEEQPNESQSMCMGSPDKATGNNGDRAQQGKPPPSSASSGASSQGCRWRIGVTKRMNREGYHPVLMVNEYCGTGRPATMNTGWHRMFSQRPGLIFGVLDKITETELICHPPLERSLIICELWLLYLVFQFSNAKISCVVISPKLTPSGVWNFGTITL